MLLWFVEQEVATTALARRRLIEEEEVETRPEQVLASCLDENVCIGSTQKYFTPDAWTAVVHVTELVKDHAVWYCGTCTRSITDETEDSIVCESCLMWYHFECASIRSNPKSRKWFVALVIVCLVPSEVPACTHSQLLSCFTLCNHNAFLYNIIHERSLLHALKSLCS